jgi:hypothetical protein
MQVQKDMKERHQKEFEAYWVCRDYDRVRSGELAALPSCRMTPDIKYENMKTLIQYLVEDILELSPEEAVELISQDTLRLAKLGSFSENLSHLLPTEFSKDENYARHVIHHAYPHLRQPSMEERVIDFYKDILSGRRKKFHEDFFWDEYGEKRAEICLEYLRGEILGFDLDKWESLFVNFPTEGKRLLKKHKLDAILEILYPSTKILYKSIYQKK